MSNSSVSARSASTVSSAAGSLATGAGYPRRGRDLGGRPYCFAGFLGHATG